MTALDVDDLLLLRAAADGEFTFRAGLLLFNGIECDVHTALAVNDMVNAGFLESHEGGEVRPSVTGSVLLQEAAR
jgi:tRNA U34 5-carboxymethylaminomethyl modifying GTPase MnmE/TrmE